MSLEKILFATCGWFFLVIGIIGIVVPLLPTTPFLILASLCFARSSEKFHIWLVTHKTFGPPIRDWNERKAIAVRYKILATAMLALSSYLVLTNSRIPEVGIWSYFIFIAALLTFIWTRNSN